MTDLSKNLILTKFANYAKLGNFRKLQIKEVLDLSLNYTKIYNRLT